MQSACIGYCEAIHGLKVQMSTRTFTLYMVAEEDGGHAVFSNN